MRHLYRIIKRLLLAIIVLPLSYLLIAVIASFIQINPETQAGEKNNPVYITSNGIHTSIILPLADVTELVDLADFPGYQNEQFMMIGWGDKAFFLNTPQWSDLTLKTAITSTLLPTDSVLHLTLIDSPHYFTELNTYQLTQTQYQSLLNAIITSGIINNGQFVVYPNKGYSSLDNFYQGVGNYHLFNTCNTWTNDMMAAADLTHSLWTPFAFGIMRNKAE